MPARRLEDRIRDLCMKSLYAKGPDWTVTIHELQLLIQEHLMRASNVATASNLKGQPVPIEERRHS